jgi:hypothetical protein
MADPEVGSGARGSGARSSVGRRRRGRPSLLDSIRRQASQEAIGAPEEGVAPAGGELVVQEASLVQAEPALPSGSHQLTVPAEVFQSLHKPLPPLPTHPLGEAVIRYAGTGTGFGAAVLGDSVASVASAFWSPRANVWASSSMVAQVQGTGMGSAWIRSAERRLSSAGDLAERQRQVDLQVYK